MDESDNLAAAGTDTVMTDDSDNTLDGNSYDPGDPDTEDDQEGVTDEEGQQSDDEETVGAEEAEENTAEGEQEDTFTLPSGETVTRKDLLNGYLREQDYTRKSQANADERRQLATEREELTTSVKTLQAIQTKLVDSISQFIPPAPDAALAATNAHQYVQQKAAHDAAMAQLQSILSIQDEVEQVQGGMSQAEQERHRRSEGDKLLAAHPELRDPAKAKAFFGRAYAAAEAAGFTRAEAQGVMDSRIYSLAALAAEGLEARQAKQKATEKVKKAPTKQPRNRRSNGQFASSKQKAEAMNRLKGSGTVDDAVQVLLGG